MKILSVEQIREADAYTIKNEPVSSVQLMERAASACVDYISGKYSKAQSFVIFCGKGNNGGDGLAIARQLHSNGYKVELFELNHTDKASNDYLLNKTLINELSIPITKVDLVSDVGLINPDSVIIDAILGSGLSRTLDGLLAAVVNTINHTTNTVISIDIPTGLFSEGNTKNSFSRVVKANETLTFQFPKLSFLFPESGSYVGEFKVLNIGIHKSFIEKANTDCFLTEQINISNILKKRERFSHKGTYGHALLVAGSYGKMGAAILAAKAVLRSGAGLLTVHIPKIGYDIVQTSLPEAMVEVDESKKHISSLDITKVYDSIGVGPGLGKEVSTINTFEELLKSTQKPMVIDADALNILSENHDLLKQVPKNSILTPHPKEFERLIGEPSIGLAQMNLQKEFSNKYGVYVLLKGAYTRISTPAGLVYFNSSGTTGLATAGSGDVLTGIITGLLAQKYSSFEAAVIGAYIHGLAGELAAKKMSDEAMMASDIIASIGSSFLELKKATG